jgi:hypothetical protein
LVLVCLSGFLAGIWISTGGYALRDLLLVSAVACLVPLITDTRAWREP